ncbi:hypothetical protein [Candidatus Aquiluna sp. UB-MaderosW2red]|uniref:hypothetical protein n=1 Tax=Candidatus Aquiluna sp. UB-MaderosW2red TaxID=1855377 RepID=UPI000875BAE5|nr:hypothetical protein [Candidatus Aquiluna sp. UB-MaderosW2red]SCX05847.1 hypothetical protein SAMN05216534_0455 [Candidatus Aquiluna sp. UB-MaderosW2red]
MTDLFERGYLRDHFDRLVRDAIAWFERKPEDEILSRSTDDLLKELLDRSLLAPLAIGPEPIDGGIAEGTVDVSDEWGRDRRTVKRPVFKLHAEYEFDGEEDLLYYKPSTSLAFTRIQADVRDGRLTVRIVMDAGQGVDAEAARRGFEQEIDKVRTNAGHSRKDVEGFNSSLATRLRPAVERRKSLIQSKRDLAGALGFPLKKRTNAPASLPLQRKVLGTQRTAPATPRQPYKDEWALTDGQYEDAIQVIGSAMLSMERTPSVVAGKDEEELRDYILVMLNGTFQGAATGETFVKTGKTDILIRVEDRHVFVGECKWWKGAKGLGSAIDQLLGYLPWRDEKAALIVFIDNRDASAVFDKAEEAIKAHPAHKRVGKGSSDKTKRRNFILGHPEDREREIQLAVLFVVLPKGKAEQL